MSARCSCTDFAQRWICSPSPTTLVFARSWPATEYLAHYNEHRPHRALDQQAPLHLGDPSNSIEEPDPMRLRRSEVLGGLICEYRLVA